MSKPILWLGPLEELEADFDPLLGRSPTQRPIPATSSIPKATLDPSRSVFDEPVNDTLAPRVSDVGGVSEPIAPTAEQTQSDSVWVQTADIREPAQEEQGYIDPVVVAPLIEEPLIEDTAVAQPPSEPLDVAAEPNSETGKTDFTHNNDPIPVRHGAPTSILIGNDDRLSAEPPAPKVIKKSFFATLFALPATAVADDAKTPVESEGEISSGLELDARPSLDRVEGTQPTATLSDDASRPEIEAPLRGRNIWAEIQDTPSDEIADGVVAHTSDEATTTQDDDKSHIDAQDPALNIEPIALTTAPVEVVEAVPNGEIVTPVSVPSSPEDAPEVPEQCEAEPVVAEPIVLEGQVLEMRSQTVSDIEPTPPVAVSSSEEVEISPVAPTTPTPSMNFQNAFNADKFWALPKGANQPYREHDEASDPDAITDDVANFDPSSRQNSAEASALAATPDVTVDALVSTEIQEELPLSIAPPKPRKRSATGKRRKKKVKKNYVGAVLGTVAFSFAAIMTIVSGLAAFGYPFDLVSSYRWYWVILSVASAAIWGLSRGWKMVVASFVVMGANLFVTVPASGKAPSGGKTATAVVGWANVAGNDDALARVFRDAEKKKATLLMVAETPTSIMTPPAGWTLIEAPVPGDPTAIAVLTKTTWRAATVPGEPTMARPPAGDLTVIGVHPQEAVKSRRRTPMRDALINRAGARAGIQEGPTIVLGDFNAASWDGSMRHFVQLGNVERVRCGGWAGSTLTQAFGLIGVATDHAFVRDVTVTHCQLGGSLTGGNHKPIWLYVAPKRATATPSKQP